MGLNSASRDRLQTDAVGLETAATTSDQSKEEKKEMGVRSSPDNIDELCTTAALCVCGFPSRTLFAKGRPGLNGSFSQGEKKLVVACFTLPRRSFPESSGLSDWERSERKLLGGLFKERRRRRKKGKTSWREFLNFIGFASLLGRGICP